MILKTILSITLILGLCANQLSAQSKLETSGFRDLFKPVAEKSDYSVKIDPSNEFKLILTAGFAFYKTFVSSQDATKCTFYPSCSVYAVQTIQTNGLWGVLDAIDRLTRCNGISPEKYTIHQPSQLYYDPVRKIRH
ncbi:MAG: membrane protein insertion efficiency factor YidD [Bacteroidales bacterium]|jgi:hypothetical protein|nr:membrane protein insertion efficiency factor YidD [Bacteroidales bacterium]MDD2569599.1 membrane protein insertion efficiency factor YidD [Bacteroidales bacterium]MDD2812223.1 membrane protein insertion efficiency factor YidD [Bacteroidales bacterium]MDD3384580.1 membrane protein insertion efficiency factor YidD [Bacteroidales bacterium]MDD3812452.1 membrane protein insertion efficiency factor YidD [Bacteroidales bacterium]